MIPKASARSALPCIAIAALWAGQRIGLLIQ